MKVHKQVIEVDGAYPRTLDRLELAAGLAAVLAADFGPSEDGYDSCAAAAIKETIVHLHEAAFECEDDCDEAAEALITDAGPIAPCVKHASGTAYASLDACGGGGCQ